MSESYVPNERSIQFTQYMLPSGRRHPQWIERTGDTLAKARAIESAGFVFEAEMLRDYRTVSFEVLHGFDREDTLALVLVENGPAVVGAIDKLINEAFDALQSRETGEAT